jgi:two-component system chemotaxis response regulator CheB
MFRSAAVAYGTRAIGVILSGALDDGTAGISAIKRCGGTAIVQSPVDAQFPDMPRSAVRSANVDYVVPHREIAPAIQTALAQIAESSPLVPEDLAVEAQFAERSPPPHEEDKSGALAPLRCSDCRRSLTPVPESTRLSCPTARDLALWAQGEGDGGSMDAALWAAIRHFEHRANLHWTLANDHQCRGYGRAAVIYGQRAHEAEAHAYQLRKLLFGSLRSGPVGAAQAQVRSPVA